MKSSVLPLLSIALLLCVLVLLVYDHSELTRLKEQQRELVELQTQDNKNLSGMAEKVDKIHSMLADMKTEYSLIGKSDLERVKAEIAMHDDELIECDPTKEKGCMEFTIYGTERDSTRFYTVSLHWTLPRFQVYPKRVHWKIIKGLLGEDLTDADTVLDSRHC